MLVYLISFLIVITIVVGVHEYGHYLAAKRCGVKVEEFAIGFGKVIFSRRDKDGVLWQLRLFPLGGYVKMFGDGDGSSFNAPAKPMTEEEKKQSFFYKNSAHKMLISVAGPAFNYILAFVIYTAVFAIFGMQKVPLIVNGFDTESPANEAGIKIGDKIVKAGGEEVEDFLALRRTLITTIAPETTLDILRDNKPMTFNVKLKDHKIGVTLPTAEVTSLNIFQASKVAIKELFMVSKLSLQALGQMIIGQRSIKELSGPIKIAQHSGEAGSRGFLSLILFIGVISVNLGLINLLPLPVLDGGHIAIYTIESVIRRRLPDIVYQGFYYFGVGILILLTSFTFINDITGVLGFR